jgi:hypothetical protein
VPDALAQGPAPSLVIAIAALVLLALLAAWLVWPAQQQPNVNVNPPGQQAPAQPGTKP